MVITDEMDAVLLHQRGSDENSWQTEEQEERKKKKDSSMTKTWTHEDTDGFAKAGAGMVKLISLIYLCAF